MYNFALQWNCLLYVNTAVVCLISQAIKAIDMRDYLHFLSTNNINEFTNNYIHENKKYWHKKSLSIVFFHGIL